LNHDLLEQFGNRFERMERAISSLQQGNGVLISDSEDRENEGDLIFPAQSVTESQMAMMIRECSGIVCLCMTPELADTLSLPLMAEKNTSRFGTAYMVSIEAAKGVTTGVSAHDRMITVRTAVADDARPDDLHRPGHIFPLRARQQGVLERPGHTEATVDIMRIAGLKPCGVLCELTNKNGTMARLPELISFGLTNDIPVITVQDLVAYRRAEVF
jgi:3,4-dihydroxy 2-butanone 4-phosphate synthase